ncbi:hypothetical protein ACFQBR_04355 [Nocardiopsis tropica]|uniref:hypothetical protein n=1 Tax=Nocardiopsis tropica TaxID=109330 RepID=UPI0031E28D6A
MTAPVTVFQVVRYTDTPFWYALCRRCGWHVERSAWATALDESVDHVRQYVGREDEHAAEVPF